MASTDPTSAPVRAYHHGNLAAALVDAAITLMEEGGPERVSVREAAKRAGVSPGAPFRHFANRTALMTAVAEEAMGRFQGEIERAMRAAPSDDPIARLRALGLAYLQWAVRNPTHFQVVSDRKLIDFEGSAALTSANAEIRAQMDAILMAAAREGRLRGDDLQRTGLAARAFVYGLARMYIDGQFEQWAPKGEPPTLTMAAALDQFIAGLLR